MATYVCSNCGKELDSSELEFIRCPYCGNKVLFKKTPPVLKKFSSD
ncbi:MAG: DNA-directed RNA polymerase subunit P [Candidatus Micrarchaeota archaeon]